jgi:hypothetical protein
MDHLAAGSTRSPTFAITTVDEPDELRGGADGETARRTAIRSATPGHRAGHVDRRARTPAGPSAAAAARRGGESLRSAAGSPCRRAASAAAGVRLAKPFQPAGGGDFQRGALVTFAAGHPSVMGPDPGSTADNAQAARRPNQASRDEKT